MVSGASAQATPEGTSASMSFPGGVTAVVSPQTRLEWVGQHDRVCQLRLQQGSAEFQVPAGTDLELETSGSGLLARDAQARVNVSPQGTRVDCLGGEVTVSGLAQAPHRMAVGESLVLAPAPAPAVGQAAPQAEAREIPQASSGTDSAIWSVLPSLIPIVLSQTQNQNQNPVGLPTSLPGVGLPGLNLPNILGSIFR